MKYYQCINCVFFVTKDDVLCANCRLIDPLKPLDTTYSGFSNFIFLIMSLIISFVVAGSLGKIFSFDFGVFIFLLIMASLIVGKRVLSNNERSNNRVRISGRGFRNTKAHIEKRYSEIAARGKQMNTVLIKAKKHNGKEWAEVCMMLEDALLKLADQQLRYQAKSLEIDIVRQQNKLSPIIKKLNTATFEEIDQNLESVEKVSVDCSAINNEFKKIYDDLDDKATAQTVNHRIEETLNSCEKLHQAFIGRQAVLALQSVNPLTEALESPLSINGAFNESDVFNSQVSITDFTESFNELEAEYIRLNTEEDLAKQVSTIINKANNI